MMGKTIHSPIGPIGVQPAQNASSMSSVLGGQHGLLGSPYQQMTAAAAYNTLLGQQSQYNANRQTYDWVWNGRPVSITEFAELAYGDTAQRTMFLLKYSTQKETT